MFSNYTLEELEKAIHNPNKYVKGKERKQLQIAYDKMLDELSQYLFQESCFNKIAFRQKVNKLNESDNSIIPTLKNMLRDQNLLFDSTYRDHSDDIIIYLEGSIKTFFEKINNG